MESPLSSFLAPAAPRAELWRTALGAILAFALYSAGAFAIIWGGAALLFDGNLSSPALAGETPTGLLLLLFHFIAMAAAVAVVTRLLHRRPARSLLGDTTRLWSDFRSMAAIALTVGTIGMVSLTLFADVSWERGVLPWLALLPLAFPLILLQTGAEELVFRGYLLQQLGARFGVGAWSAWMMAPSLLFVAGHIDPTSQGQNVLVVAGVIFLFSIITADVTARTGSLGAAWGLHFVNNVIAILFVTLEGPLSGLSLGALPFPASSATAIPWLLLDAVGLTLVYVIWRWRHG